MAPSSTESTRRRTKERSSKDALAADSPQKKVCKEGETVWAEFDFESDPFVSPDGNTKPTVKKTKSASSEKDDDAKPKRSSKSDVKKSSRSKSSRDGEGSTDETSLSPEKKSKPKSSKTSDDKKTESSTKQLRNKSDTPSLSSRVRSESPSAANRRRDKAIENGSSVYASVKRTKPKREESRSSDALETPSRRRVVPIADLASSRTRAVQRADARKSWRETHVPSKEGSVSGDADDVLDAKLQSHTREERRVSLLDQSRKGPVRISSRLRSRRDDDESDSCYDNDDDDDLSVMSSSSRSYMSSGLEAPFPNRRVSCAGGYLGNDLNATPSRQGRRASALGSSLDRAQLIYSLKPKDDDDDDDDKSAYTLPTGLGSANTTNSQFEIGRSSSNTRARRMSLSTPLVIPCVNGSNTDLSTPAEQSQRAEKTERKAKKGDILSLSDKSKKASGDACDKAVDKGGHGTYDSAVDDMLKNRRLRGARGDAPAKKVEEKPAATNRRMSLGMLTNFVNPNQPADRGVRPNEAAMRRPSRI